MARPQLQMHCSNCKTRQSHFLEKSETATTIRCAECGQVSYSEENDVSSVESDER